MPPSISSNQYFEDRTFKKENLDQDLLELTEFLGCTFIECSFTETIFRNCKFEGSRFQNCDLSLVQFPDSIISGNQFQDSKLVGIDWTQANWGATLLQEPLIFMRCVLNHSTFISLDLQGVKIQDCIVSNVDFREVDLTQANFQGSDLSESLFSKTNLSKADLSQARNYSINPEDNTLSGAKFSLPEAMSLLYNLDIELIDLD